MENIEKTFDVKEKLSESSISSAPKFRQSKKKWSLDLLDLTLHPSFGGLFRQLLGRDEYMHFISFSWDLSPVNSFSNPNLNSIGNFVPLDLSPGKSHHFGDHGLNLFPSKHIQDALNVVVFIYKSKSPDFIAQPILEQVNRKIKESLLFHELSELVNESSVEKKAYLDYLEGTLCGEITALLETPETKYITTFDKTFLVENESQNRGPKQFLENHVRLQLTLSQS